MLIIQKPMSSFTKVPNKVIMDSSISHGARVLYGVLCCLMPGQNYTDKYLMKILDVSVPTLTRYKRELKEKDLLLVSQVTRKLYFTFVGLPSYPASKLHSEYLSRQRKLEEAEQSD